MLSLPFTFEYYFYSKPVDMRKSFNGLYHLIMDKVSEKTLPGKMFIFLNKKRNKLKVLYWDQDGFAIWYKNLQKGLFQFPSCDQDYLEIKSEVLQQIFYGFDLKSIKKQKRFSIDML